MTKLSLPLAELFEKGADADFVREMSAFLAQRLMEADVKGLCGAAHGERCEERSNYRNGYRERRWDTRAGSIPLNIPKLLQGSYFPGSIWYRRFTEFDWKIQRLTLVTTRTRSSMVPASMLPKDAFASHWTAGRTACCSARRMQIVRR